MTCEVNSMLGIPNTHTRMHTHTYTHLHTRGLHIGVAKPGHTRAAARASPIFAPASASYLEF